MEYLSLNLLTLTFSLPLFSMLDPDFSNMSLSTSFDSCISMPTTMLDGDSDVCWKTKRDILVREENLASKKIAEDLVKNVKIK